MRILPACAAVAVMLAATALAQDLPRQPDGTIQFRHALDNEPLALEYRPQQTMTDAVRRFHQSGENPYDGDTASIDAGRRLYNQWCASCHLPDASGRIGPSLVGTEHRYPRVGTDVGLFEVIYGGAAGAMQAFGRRIDQDQILKVMSFLRTLQKPG